MSREELELLRAKRARSAEKAIQIGTQGTLTPGFNGVAAPEDQFSPNPGLFESSVGSTAREVQALPGEVQASLDNPGSFLEGMKIGLVQEEGMAKEARKLGVKLEDPAVRLGVMTSQLGKAGAEVAIMDLMTAGLAPVIQMGLKIPAVKASIGPIIQSVTKIAQGSPILKKGLDVAEGAAAGVASNAGANLGAGAVSEVLGGDGLSSTNLEATGNESLITGAISGAINPFVKGNIANEGRALGAEQFAVDEGRVLNQAADEVTNKVASGKANSVNAVKQVHAERVAELAPVKAKADAIEKRFLNSNEKVDITEIPGQLKDFVKQLRDRRFGKVVTESAEGRELIEIFKGNEDLFAKGKIRKSDLLSIKDNVDSIMTKGFTRDGKAEFGRAAGYAKGKNVRKATIDMLPKEFREVDEAFTKIHGKYGDRFNDDFSDMNNVYNKLDDGQDLGIEDSIDFLTNPKSSVASKKIGEFADKGILDVEDIENAFFSKADTSGKTFFKSSNKGKSSDSIKQLDEGKNFSQISESQGQRFTDKSLLENLDDLRTGNISDNLPSSTVVKGERSVDPTKVAGKLAAVEDSIVNSVGSNSQKAQEISDSITTLNFLKQKGPKAVKAAAAEAQAAKRSAEGAGDVSAASLLDPKAIQGNILLNKLGQNLGPTAIRQALQTGGGFFTGNKFGVAGK